MLTVSSRLVPFRSGAERSHDRQRDDRESYVDTQSDENSFPVVGGPDLFHNGELDVFVTKINATGTALLYSGYIGGLDTDSVHGIAVDGAGNAYVSGTTRSNEFSFPVLT